MTDHRISYRWLGGVLFIGLFAIILYGLSCLYSYFNTGASKKDIYHADVAYFEEVQPHVTWINDDNNIEGTINPYIRRDIAKAYTSAIRALDISQKLDEDVALKEHFTLPLAHKIRTSLDTNHLVDFERVHLTHTLQLHLLSLDKSVVSFTDVQSRIKKKVSGNYIDDLTVYHINMILVDGRWRIDALEKTTPTKTLPEFNKTQLHEKLILAKGINYYPSATPWRAFWTEYDTVIIEKDLAIIKDLGFKTVRFFIPFKIFGGGNVDPLMLEKMDHLVAAAKAQNIYLIPTLFDFPIGYELDKYPMYDRHLEILLTRYDKVEQVLYWDLKNEANLDFEHLGKEQTMEWLSFIIERAKIYSSKPLTLGWSDWYYADLFCNQLDIVSFHYYKEVLQLEEAIISVKLNCDKPIVVSEYGMSTYNGFWPGGHTEQGQAEYYKGVEEILNDQEVGGVAWCLYDYGEAPRNVFGWKPWIRATQKKYGILTVDGNRKKVSIETK